MSPSPQVEPHKAKVETGIGWRLRQARERRGWTRETLAHYAGVSWAAITQIESGRRTDVRLKTLGALASALALPVDYFVAPAGSRPSTQLKHRAIVYKTPGEFVETAIPFLREGLQQAHAVIAVTTRT